jgi:hypothetical protein
MLASLRGSVGTGKGEDESSTRRVWAARFHHVTARSRLARVFKLMNLLFLDPEFATSFIQNYPWNFDKEAKMGGSKMLTLNA